MTTTYKSSRAAQNAAQHWLLLAGAWTLVSCNADPFGAGKDGFSEQEWELVLRLEPLKTPPPENPFNELEYDPAAAALGHKMFFETAFSSEIKVEGPSGPVGETGLVGCVTCHDPEAYFADPRPTGGMSHGTDYTLRNTPSLVNSAYYNWFNWGGRRDSLSSQGATTLETDTNAASSRLLVAHVVYTKYKDEYEAIFGPLDPALDPAAPDAARFPATGAPKASADAPDGPWELMPAEDRLAVNWIMANIGRTYEAYGRKLVSGSSPFGRYIQDQKTPDFSAAARRGLALFIGKAACNECHNGPVLSDNKFHNLGVPQVFDEHTPLVDEGRFEDVPRMIRNAFNAAGVYSADPEAGAAKLDALDPEDESTKGQFRTPSLLNVAKTAPYFHNGSASTLEDVIWHYDMGGGEPGRFAGEMDPKMQQLRLSDAEIRDLIAFLTSLTGEPVPEEWRASPF